MNLTLKETIGIIVKNLAIRTFDPVEDRALDLIVAEYIRQAVLQSCQSLHESHGPVHIGAILSQIRKKLRGFQFDVQHASGLDHLDQSHSSDSGDDPVRRTFKRLVSLREINHQGGGYYLPTPLRLVKLKSGDALVIGCINTQRIEKELGIELTVAGLGRIIRHRDLIDKLERESKIWQPLHRWLGQPKATLEDWWVDFIEKKRMEAGNRDYSIPDSDFEVYYPIPQTHNYQSTRWMSSSKWNGDRDELYLCRSGTKRGPRRYWLGQLGLRNQSVCIRSEITISNSNNSTVRRLMYGYDQFKSAPTTVRSVRNGCFYMLDLNNFLPDSEERLLTALATDARNRTDRMSLKYVIHQRWYEDIADILQGLGILVRESR